MEPPTSAAMDIDHPAAKQLPGPSENPDPKQRLQQNIKTFFDQLTKGCGRLICSNPNCASNPGVAKQDASKAAANAIKLATSPDPGSFMCKSFPTSPSPSSAAVPISTGAPTKKLATSLGASPISSSPPAPAQLLDLVTLRKLIDEANSSKNYTPLIRRIGAVFGQGESLNFSFLKGDPAKPEEVPATAKDPGIDFAAVQQAFSLIQGLKHEGALNALLNASERAAMSMRLQAPRIAADNIRELRQYLILFENPLIWDEAYQKAILTPLFTGMSSLVKPLQQILTDWFADWPAEKFKDRVGAIQQIMTLRIVRTADDHHVILNRDEQVTSAVKVLGLFNSANERVHYLPWTAFYNELILENYDIREDFINWKNSVGFSFCNFPFIMDAQLKSKILHFESVVLQQYERQEAFRRTMLQGAMEAPVCVFKIHRQRLLSDALRELSRHDPEDFKKELKVHFYGEEAVDEGGVQKEFFQLIVKEIFNPMFGMFKMHEGKYYWFNRHSTDFDEFKLIGLILGLAIYNGVILDVHFPFVLYKKMMGMKPTREDLKSFNASLYTGFEKLLAYTGNVEEDIGGNFTIAEEYLGEVKHTPLKPNGEHIPITNANREEYVDLVTQYLLEQSIEKQFNAFISGFKTVCNSQAFSLLRPEELELCICGSPVLDFEALEQATEYEGYTRDSQIIKWFWDIVHHQLTLDQKKRLLFFSTGTDRAPVGGLGKMKFIVVRHGGDSDRLPESHTCFNHFMLPAYKTKEKLYEMLLQAIVHAEGFGMI